MSDPADPTGPGQRDVTPKAGEVTPEASDVTPKAGEVTPEASGVKEAGDVTPDEADVAAAGRQIEVGWFAALCDDDYDRLGVPDPALASSWEHCRAITVAADTHGFDTVLLPSGYALGIDSTAFTAGIATQTESIRLLLAVRMGETVLPQLARQLATIDQMAQGRLLVNVISSEVPGEPLPGPDRYRRTLEYMDALRTLMNGERLERDGEFVKLAVDPPRLTAERRRCPPFYFGGLSEEAKDCAARGADVYLTWPDRLDRVAALIQDMSRRAGAVGRRLRFGWRSHVIVRETEDEARAAARRLVSSLDDATGRRIRSRSLDSGSTGVARQAELRDEADDEGYVERHLWTGIGRARSGAGAAIVGDPDQVLATLERLSEIGVESFILSGYPHLSECDLFARHVLGRMSHRPLYGLGPASRAGDTNTDTDVGAGRADPGSGAVTNGVR